MVWRIILKFILIECSLIRGRPDCVLAERLIHKYLDKYRINPKREFFKLPLKEAVKIVFKICLKVNNSIKKKAGKKLALFIDIAISKLCVKRIKNILQMHKGRTPVFITMDLNDDKKVELLVGEELYVKFSPTLINDLKPIKGIRDIEWHTQKISEFGILSERIEIIEWDS